MMRFAKTKLTKEAADFLESVGGEIDESSSKRLKSYTISKVKIPQMTRFWEEWNKDKEFVKDLGFGLSKTKSNGGWNVTHFHKHKQEEVRTLTPQDIQENLQKAYPYQVEHIKNLVRVLCMHNVCLDASDTGTGKTYCAILTAKILGMRPIVVHPLSVRKDWQRAMEFCGVEDYILYHHEALRKGKQEIFNGYKWELGEQDLLIFDEAHKVSNPRTLNGKMLVRAVRQGIPVLLLSATAILDPVKAATITEALGFHGAKLESKKLFLKTIGGEIDYFNRFKLETWDTSRISVFHKMIFPEHGSRMRIADIPEFPENLTLMDPLVLGEENTRKIDEAYMKIHEEIQKRAELHQDKAKYSENKLIYYRQAIETLKVPIIVDLTSEALSQGRHVAIFLNFLDSIKGITDFLENDKIPYSIIKGGQSVEERANEVQKFQSDKSKVIVCIVSSGGTGISLHDVNGRYPRVSLISPDWSAHNIKQALGRVHRAGGKSKSIQRIIFAANTVEERIAVTLKKKIDVIGNINDSEKFESDIYGSSRFFELFSEKE